MRGRKMHMIPITESELTDVTVREPESSSLGDVCSAIQLAYPLEDGQMIVKHIRTAAQVSWYRVNWYRQGSNGLFIDRSRFLALRKTPDGLQVEDQTLTSAPKRFSDN
jgi:hypothetical protein